MKTFSRLSSEFQLFECASWWHFKDYSTTKWIIRGPTQLQSSHTGVLTHISLTCPTASVIGKLSLVTLCNLQYSSTCGIIARLT